jgi:hypothetical protein
MSILTVLGLILLAVLLGAGAMYLFFVFTFWTMLR